MSDGIGEATQAFEAVMEAEQPSRSKKASEERKPPARMDVEELFPRRNMDRSESEGGANDEPEIVKRRRAAARQDDDEPKRRPVEEDEDDEDETQARSEPSEEEDNEPDQDDQERAQEQGQLDLSQIVEVNVDGQPVEVSLNEALRGYIRQETFHQRLGELSNGVQALQTQRQEMAGAQAAFVERAQALEAYVAAFMPKEPDWDALYAHDPAEAARHERKWRSFQEQVNQLVAHRQATQHELDVENQRNIVNFANANRAKLANDHPEWKSEKTWKRDHDSMRRTARNAGYTDQEIDQLYDARGVEILLKASKYDRMMATKPKPVTNGYGGPTKRNGTTPSRNVTRAFDRAEQRLSRTGSLSAAADVFERILDREG